MGSYSGYNLSYNAIDKRSLNTASFRPLSLNVLSDFEDKKRIVFSDFLILEVCLPYLIEDDRVSYIPINTLAKYSTRSISLNRSGRIQEIYSLEEVSDYFGSYGG